MEKIDLSKIWPEWQIEGPPLGSGSFGSVYKGVRKDNMVESYAAIKVISIPKHPSEIDSLRAEGLDTDRAVTYLQGVVNDCVSEIQLMESLKGIQNIVSVEDYKVVKKNDEIGWDIYIRMELLTPLTTYITEHKMTEKDVIKLGCDICSALEVCSKKGIIHRDIKPENIFVNEFGDFKLGDFGIARKLEGQISNLSRKGTPNYMAPEVANSKDYDSRVDTYSLGIVLYRFLNSNRLPFLNNDEQATNPVERENASVKRLRGEKLPPPCNASAQMAEVVLHACAYNPNARFQDATQMKQALQAVLDGTIAKTKRRSKWIIAVAAVAVVLLGSLAALYFTGILPNFVNQIIAAANADELEAEQTAAIAANADTLAQAQDYEGAIAALEAGLATYPEAELLQSKLTSYQEEMKEFRKNMSLEEANALAEGKDYVAAIALLQEAIDQQGDYPEFVEARDTYQAEYENFVREEALAEANRLAASGDNLGAAKKIEEVITALGESEELLAHKIEHETAYVNQVVKEADDLLLLEDFDGAESIINAAIVNFPTNELLLDESHRIQNARPVYLLDQVKPYKKSAHYNQGSTIRMGGNNYLHGFTCMGYGDYNEGNQTIFNLEGKYSLISFTAGIVADQDQRVTFLFHADDELVYKFSMQGGNKPTNHVFNIVGCKQFKISVFDGTNSIDKSGTYGLADIMVTRNISSLDETETQLAENQVYLLDEMRPYLSPSHYESPSSLSMGGLNYSHGFSCMGYGSYNVGNKTYFNLDERFSKMTFTTGLVLDRNLNVTFRFYTDGKLAYEVKMGEADLATTHSINVQGCKQLMICVSDNKQSAESSGTYGIANIIMDKSSTYDKTGDGQPLQPGESYLLSVVEPHVTPSRYNDGTVLSMGGYHYSQGFSCMGYGNYNKGNETAFNLDGKYKEISFTAGIILDRGLNVTYRFLADGKLVYEFTMKEGDLPTEHSFSVEGCSELVICVYDRQRGADSSGTYGLANIVVSQ